MNYMQIVIRIVIGFLLVIHGFAHWHITTAWDAQPAAVSWLLRNVGLDQASIHTIGNVLWVVTLLAFIATGIFLFSGLSWWRPLAILSSLLSLLTIALFWQPNMVLGVLVDGGILIALFWIHWPTTELVGV
jgi:hypothetical protein